VEQEQVVVNQQVMVMEVTLQLYMDVLHELRLVVVAVDQLV
tara:strand:+ start:342 stop:464 length:123 start_codon:yes stop_codon:yes gene_type:complete